MSKTLVTYFTASAGHVTERVAKRLAPHVKGGEIIADKLLTLDMGDEEYRFV